MNADVFVIVSLAGLYVLLGLLFLSLNCDPLYREYDISPLWKIPMVLLWPIALIILLIASSIEIFVDYIKSVMEYHSKTHKRRKK